MIDYQIGLSVLNCSIWNSNGPRWYRMVPRWSGSRIRISLREQCFLHLWWYFFQSFLSQPRQRTLWGWAMRAPSMLSTKKLQVGEKTFLDPDASFFSRLQPEQRQPWLCGRRRRSTPRLKHNHVEQCKQMVTQDQLQEHRATMQFVQTKSVKHVELQQHWICSSFLPIQIQRQRMSLIWPEFHMSNCPEW